MNAAIEAARAGEQGRGFAVVADEVRKLAERTTTATAEITGMIKGIQSDTDKAVHAMEESSSAVERGRQLIDSAGDSLNEILGMSARVSSMIQQIATAAEEESATSEEISRTIEKIDEITNENAKGAEETARETEQLSRQAVTLAEIANEFKL